MSSQRLRLGDLPGGLRAAIEKLLGAHVPTVRAFQAVQGEAARRWVRERTGLA